MLPRQRSVDRGTDDRAAITLAQQEAAQPAVRSLMVVGVQLRCALGRELGSTGLLIVVIHLLQSPVDVLLLNVPAAQLRGQH